MDIRVPTVMENQEKSLNLKMVISRKEIPQILENPGMFYIHMFIHAEF